MKNSKPKKRRKNESFGGKVVAEEIGSKRFLKNTGYNPPATLKTKFRVRPTSVELSFMLQ